MKLHVTQSQLGYYQNRPSNSETLCRLIREFDLHYNGASEVLSHLQSSDYSDFEVLDSDASCIIPAHPKDNRRYLYLPSDQYDWLFEELDGQCSGDFFSHFTSLDLEGREEVLARFVTEFLPADLTDDMQDLLMQMNSQSFLGIRRLDLSVKSTIEEISGWMRSKVNAGESLAKIVSVLLNWLPTTATPLERVIMFTAIADLLYDDIEEVMATYSSR
jgi:hypothetical protein